MNRIVEYICGIIVITITNIYMASKLLKKIPNLKSIKTYVIFLIMATFTLINYFYNSQFIRILTITIFMSVILKVLFEEKLNKTIISTVISQMIYMIAEFIFAFGLMYIFKVDPNNFVSIYFGRFITNLIISIIAIIIVQFKFVKKFYNLLLRITDKIKLLYLIMLLLTLMIIANVFAAIIYYDYNFTFIILFNTFFTVVSFLIIISSLSNKNDLIKVYDKYNTTLNSLKEYENILDRYRVSNHENKNQLLTIRNMLPKSNKKVISYIDTIVENKLKDNDRAMLDASKIPAGGLRGLVYSKVLVMKESNISYELEISKDVKTVDLINNIDDSMMLDICKVIGVYLDNSIQAVDKLQEKFVNIEMYLDKDDLVISVSNNYKGIIEIDRIEESGYTTKEKGHGYGLTLAKEIVDNNNKLYNQKSITKETFSQMLKIKM